MTLRSSGAVTGATRRRAAAARTRKPARKRPYRITPSVYRHDSSRPFQKSSFTPRLREPRLQNALPLQPAREARVVAWTLLAFSMLKRSTLRAVHVLRRFRILATRRSTRYSLSTYIVPLSLRLTVAFAALERLRPKDVARNSRQESLKRHAADCAVDARPSGAPVMARRCKLELAVECRAWRAICVGIEADDIQTTVTRLRQAAAQVTDPRVAENTGATLANVTDPEGLRVEFLQLTPGSLQRKAIETWK